jgi:hypothetical protein
MGSCDHGNEPLGQPRYEEGGEEIGHKASCPPYPFHLPFSSYYDVSQASRYFASGIGRGLTTGRTRVHRDLPNVGKSFENVAEKFPRKCQGLEWAITPKTHIQIDLKHVYKLCRNGSIVYILTTANMSTQRSEPLILYLKNFTYFESVLLVILRPEIDG